MTSIDIQVVFPGSEITIPPGQILGLYVDDSMATAGYLQPGVVPPLVLAYLREPTANFTRRVSVLLQYQPIPKNRTPVASIFSAAHGGLVVAWADSLKPEEEQCSRCSHTAAEHGYHRCMSLVGFEPCGCTNGYIHE